LYPKYIYVAGPICNGNVLENAVKGVEAGRSLLEAGFSPYIPHLNLFYQFQVNDFQYEKMLAWDMDWLAKCDAMVRLPGYSPGADREQAFCRKNHIPVYFGMDDFFNNVKAIHKDN
jgi:hypothetical protein